jgi:hypothetical protein
MLLLMYIAEQRHGLVSGRLARIGLSRQLCFHSYMCLSDSWCGI